MTAVLKIKGESYRSIAEVEDAVRKLTADISLMPEDAAGRDDLAAHIGELLSAIPDENAAKLLSVITGDDIASPSDDDDVATDGATLGDDGRIGASEHDGAPVCPMCQGEGVLAVEPPQDPTAQRCPACDGYGKVYTGSRVDGQTTRDCPTCNGGGFIAKEPDIPLPPPAARAAAAPAWPNAVWNALNNRWDPPPDALPWEGATWNGLEGKYE